MTLERKPEDLETVQDTTSWDFEEPAPVAVSEPTVPTGLPESEREELRSRAEGLASELADAEGVKEMELIDNVTNLGMQAQKNGGKQLELLRVRVGDLISESGSDSNLASGLVDLRMALNEIDPNQMSRPGVLRSITSVFPFVGVIVPPINVLKKIAMKYEPVSRQIVAIEGRLRDGRMVLTRDNVELRQLYEQVDAQRLPIQKNAYLGELLLGAPAGPP